MLCLLQVEDNVCYITLGHAYFLEDGGEKRTVLDGNLGLGTKQGSLILADSYVKFINYRV